ncbi:MAG: pyrroloquinoline quinone-dependent dehydrogenase [Hyphomicrobiaceae bacterium]
MAIAKLIKLTACLLLLAAPTTYAKAQTVNDARLLAAGKGSDDWVSSGNGYANQGYSPLDAINTKTVGQLTPRWIYQHGGKGSFQARPLVADGVMYVTLPGNDLVALAADTGKLIWRYKHKSRPERASGGTGGPANRGAAIGYGYIYQATNDGRLIALDKTTGKIAWQALVAQPVPEDLAGLSEDEQKKLRANVDRLPAKMAPLVYNNMVIVGVTSAGYGIYYNIFRDVRTGKAPSSATFLGKRGFVAAYDAKTGKELWRWHSTRGQDWSGDMRAVTKDGEKLPRDIEAEKTALSKHKDAWRIGGTSIWSTPSLDPELGLIFVGTGNASPNDVADLRPGDNLYANSLVAVDVKTGMTKWHYQQVPRDLWGYDVASTSVLFDVNHKGTSVPAVGVAGKTGWFYVHDRRNGRLLYRSEPFVPQFNMFKAPTPQGVTAAPGSWGGASWSPVSFDPSNGFVFIPGIHKPTKYRTQIGQGTNGPVTFILTEIAKDEPSWGTLSAIDTWAGGKLRWQIKTDQPLIGGVLATAGGLVFMGEGDGHFSAFDAKDGQRLWKFNAGAGVNAPPVSYRVGSTQFIAVAAGGHSLLRTPSGSALIAFSLPE